MAITDEIKQICAEIAEKLPQISGGGGGTTPSFAQITKRTSLRHWYQYLIDNYYFEMNEETYEETLVAETMESIEYPLYTQDITDFSYFANGSVSHTNVGGYLEECGFRVKKFCGTLDTSSGTNFQGMFWLCGHTEDVGELTNTSNGTNFYAMFQGCSALKSVPTLDTSNGTDFSNMFNGCMALTSMPPLDTSSGTNFAFMFNGCNALTSISLLDTSNGTNFAYMFNGCNALTSISPLDTSNGTSFDGIFNCCEALTSIPPIDVSNGTRFSSSFYNCKAITTITIKNIKANLMVGSGTSYGHLLSVDSLIGLIYECRNTGSTKTLTVGSANLSKLANVYVKLIDITDEMRAEDGFIDQKKPFEVCESTDDGAMLITNYVGLKNWKLA